MSMNQSSPHRHLLTAAGILILTAVVFLIYSNTLNSPFVFDDTGYITEDPAIRMTDLSWENIKQAALEGRPKNRLLPNISFAINYYVGHYNVLSYHLTNIIIHLASGLVLFFLVRLTLARFAPAIGTNPWAAPGAIAFFAALIWLVQPVNTQAVTYIVQRMTSLMVFFYILSLFLYAWGRSRWQDTGRLTPKAAAALFGCGLAGICAVISKQNAGMLPVMILAYEWFFFQDLRLSLSRKQVYWIIGVSAVFIAIALLYLGGDPLERILRAYTRREFTLAERVMTEWRVVIYYITLFFYPHPTRLILDHDYPLSIAPVQPMTTLICLVALITLAGLTLYLARRHRLIAFCLLWFLANLVIESSVIGIEIIYEHRTYLPFMFLIAGGVHLALTRIRPTKAALAGLCIITVVFSIWAHQRNTIWQSRVAFWADNAKKAPNDFRPHHDLGAAFYDAGQIDNAINQYRKALALKPGHADTLNNLGNAFKRKGRMNQAITYYNRAIKINPRHTKARINLAGALIQQGQFETALDHLNQVLTRGPNAEAHVNAGAALARMNRIDEAIKHFKKALAIHPDIAETHNNLGVLLIQKGDYQAAKNHFKAALRLRPGYKSARQNLEKLRALE
ncbi:MAG: tetratricopeptide repeat protein [Desulfobacterales bacterium]|nr:tetratricopeptide repeat protein [Desulfobacterales bacterium]